tara:strand:- start:334 stop:576 length:243 start_codon:yes stop_codon:yes gene_type:complete
MSNKMPPKETLIPFDSVNEKVKLSNKRVNYVQNALHTDMHNKPKRPLNEFTELVGLVGDQFDDDTSNIKREVIPCPKTLN